MRERYGDAHLALDVRDEEKSYARVNRATQTDQSSSCFHNTSSILRSIGFYPEFSTKQKLFLLLGGILISYEASRLIEAVNNSMFGFFSEENNATQHLSKNIAGFMGFIIFILTIQNMGTQLRNLDVCTEELKKQRTKINELEKEITFRKTWEENPGQRVHSNTREAVTLLKPI